MTAVSPNMNRRRFLLSATATAAWAGATAIPEQVETAPTPEVITIGPRERPLSDIESWNLGLITASRPELSLEDIEARNRELFIDLSHFGRLHVRGRYFANDGWPPTGEMAYLVIGRSDDSGNLKGALRKYGITGTPTSTPSNRVGLYYTLITRRARSPLPSSIEQLQAGSADADWLGGRWENIGFWTPRSFFSRYERRVYFNDAGNREET